MAPVILYVCDALIVAAYIAVVLGRAERDVFDAANAMLGPVLLAVTIVSFGWTPVLLLTVVFSIAGWVGLYRESIR